MNINMEKKEHTIRIYNENGRIRIKEAFPNGKESSVLLSSVKSGECATICINNNDIVLVRVDNIGKRKSENMEYKTYKEVFCSDTGESFQIGDIVTITTKDGDVYGDCEIVKITNSGFHYNQRGQKKSIQYNDIDVIYYQPSHS